MPGGRDALTEMVAPELRDLVDGLAPESAPAVSYMQGSTGFGGDRSLEVWATGVRIHAADGTLAGTALLYKPAVGMATLGAVAAMGDLGHFARMQASRTPPGDRRRSCSPTSRLLPASRVACRPPATSPSAAGS